MDVRLHVPKLQAWYDRELTRIYDEVPTRKGDDFIVMGCPVWGAAYVKEFVNWCIPTMMERESAAALKGRCRLVVCTPDADRPAILNHLHILDRYDIELQFISMPEEFLDLIHEVPQNKLFILGTAQKLVLQVARRLRASFHMLMPDHNHGAGFFARIHDLRAGNDAIVQCGISAAREPTQKELKRYRLPDNSLSIPPQDLGDIAWRNLHDHHRANVMAPAFPEYEPVSIPDKMPRTQLLLARTRNCLVAHTCRPNVVWLSARLVNEVPVELERPATLDCEVPILTQQMKGSRIYIPTAADMMTAVELSPAKEKEVESGHVPFGKFANHAWTELRYSDVYLELLRRRGEYALSPDDSVTVTDEQIARDVAKISDLLLEHRPAIEHHMMMRIATAPETLGQT